MKFRHLIGQIAAISVALALAACQSSKEVMTPSAKGAVELRAMQGRMFETGDRGKTIRTVIATLQDLGYSIEKVEAGAGTVSARKLEALKLSVSVFPRGDKQMIVRANATARTAPTAFGEVDSPEFYQKLFFEPLSKAMFLTANQDSGEEPPPVATTPAAVTPAVIAPAATKPRDAAPAKPVKAPAADGAKGTKP